MSLGIFQTFHLLIYLKVILYLLFVQRKTNIFNIHDPIGLRYLFYLRVSLSPLRSHKNRHGFDDTPSDKCLCNHGIEDNNHLLSSCTLFAVQRVSLRASVVINLLKYNLNNMINNLQLHLYGHRTINFADNRIIILSTIAFIKDLSLIHI